MKKNNLVRGLLLTAFCSVTSLTWAQSAAVRADGPGTWPDAPKLAAENYLIELTEIREDSVEKQIDLEDPLEIVRKQVAEQKGRIEDMYFDNEYMPTIDTVEYPLGESLTTRIIYREYLMSTYLDDIGAKYERLDARLNKAEHRYSKEMSNLGQTTSADRAAAKLRYENNIAKLNIKGP